MVLQLSFLNRQMFESCRGETGYRKRYHLLSFIIATSACGVIVVVTITCEHSHFHKTLSTNVTTTTDVRAKENGPGPTQQVLRGARLISLPSPFCLIFMNQ